MPVVPAPEIIMPETVTAPVDDSVLIALLVMLIAGDVFEHVRPITVLPVPVDVKLLMVFDDTVRGLALLPDEPMLMPVMVLCPVMFVTILFDRVDVVAPKYE